MLPGASAKPEILDRVNVFAPLGLKFWDPMLDQLVSSDLEVIAYEPSRPAKKVRAQKNPSGVYVFHQLPGLPIFEQNENGVSSTPQTRAYIIVIFDVAGRYTPVSFTAQAPHQGILLLNAAASPASVIKGLLLFSAPTRQVPRWLAAVRGRLFDENTNAPASNAVIRVNVATANGDASFFFGITDSKGEFLVAMPFPTTAAPYQTSPAGPGGEDLRQRMWDVSIEVQYAPTVLEIYPATGLPDYLGLLTQQRANIRKTISGALTPLFAAELEFNKQLVLQTDGDSKGRLWVSPATS